ncbi:MAG: hypothetical protein ABIZ04_04300 [Opitutus sp.]
MNSSVFKNFITAALCRGLLTLFVLGAAGSSARAAFLDSFDGPIVKDPTGIKSWNFFAGDGTPTMEFTSANGIATIHVDATTDRRGIWWAIIKRQISSSIDLAKLAAPDTELRVEARIRSSHAPRRVNLSVNTQHTTDFHGDLMEFDLGEAHVWQTISFTTHNFDGRVGDQLNAQLALMDWGLGKYDVDVDYFKVELVDPATAGPDKGVPIPYRPEIASPASFKQSIPAAAVATIDRREPDANLADWSAIESSGPVPIATVNGTQYVILRWDLSAFAGKKASGSGLLELKTHSVQRAATRRKDFGMMRVVEILGGDPQWSARSVTYESLLQGHAYEDVFNTQMIIDVDVTEERNGSTLITLSRPALQRLLDQRTKGIVLIPLGSINAAFLTGSDPAQAPRLLFNVEP